VVTGPSECYVYVSTLKLIYQCELYGAIIKKTLVIKYFVGFVL
jgi:hypothetical protein